MKKVGKTTRLFRYDLNQIPYNYTVEVTNRFKGLDLTECLKNYGQRFTTLYRRRYSKPSPRKRNAKRQNWLSEEALQTAEKRRDTKGKGQKEKYIHLNAEFQRITRRDMRAFLSEQCKETEGKNLPIVFVLHYFVSPNASPFNPLQLCLQQVLHFR